MDRAYSPKLTIGTVVYDDWDGFFFTVQSLRMHHDMNDFNLLVINTNPLSKQGVEVSNFCKTNGIKHIETTNEKGAFSKEMVFELAETPYVLVVDCHVLIKSGAIKSLVNFFDMGLDCDGLVHGPLLYDSMKVGATHMKETWGSGLLGQWALDKRVFSHDYFEIPAHGMGLFACRKAAWLGFPKKSSGFGGEEYIIHKKYHNNGRKVWCLSSLQWLHRFKRPNGIPYPCVMEKKYKNTIRGLLLEGGSIAMANKHFVENQGVEYSTIKKWMGDIISE